MPSIDLRTGKEDKGEGSSVVTYQPTEAAQLNERLFRTYDGPFKTWYTQAVEDDDFRHGAQWTQKQIKFLKKLKQLPIVFNVIHPAVEQAKALLTANRPRFTATGREDSDPQMAKVFSDLFSYIWDISHGTAELKQAIDDYYVKGLGWMLAYIDPYADMGKGEVCIRSVDPKEVRVDPNSKDIYCRDAAHILLVSVSTAEQLQRYEPNMLDILRRSGAQKSQGDDTLVTSQRIGAQAQGSANVFTEADSDKYRVIDRYTRVKIKYVHIYDTTNGREQILLPNEYEQYLNKPVVILKTVGASPTYVTDHDEAERLLAIAESVGNTTFHYQQSPYGGEPVPMPGPEVGGQLEVPNSTLTIIEKTTAEFVKKGILQAHDVWMDRIQRVMSIGGVEVINTVLPISDYPIVPLMNRHARNPFPMSDVRFVRSIQEYINWMRSLIAAHAQNAANTKLLLPNGSVDVKQMEESFAQAGFRVQTYDPELGTAVQLQPSPLPNELFKSEADAIHYIERILGIYEFQQGAVEQAPQTFKGTVALDEYGQRRIKSKLDDIEGALNQLGRVITDLIQMTYTQEKAIRILQPNNVSYVTRLNVPVFDDLGGEIKRINDVTVGKYDVIITSGSTLPSNRWARFEYFKELYQLGLIDQIEVLKQTEIVDVQAVLERFGEIARLRQQLAQAEELIKNLKGDLQTAERETKHARMQMEVNKFKGDLKTVSTRAEAAQELFQARLNDELSSTAERLDQAGGANQENSAAA